MLKIVGSQQYLAMRSDESLPEVARRMLCAAILDDETEHSPSLSRRVQWELRAAWACEDADDANGARACRMMASASLEACVAGGTQVYRQPGWEFVVIVDCLRRCADFDAALEWIERGLSADLHPRARVELEFERDLIDATDSAAHMESETPGYNTGTVRGSKAADQPGS